MVLMCTFPPGHTIEKILPLPRVAQPRWIAGHARGSQSQDGATDEEAVHAGALLPHLPAPARSTPAGGHQVPRRRLHRRRPRGHLRLPAGAPGAGGLCGRVRTIQRHLRPRGRRAGGIPEFPCLLRRAARVGAPGGRPQRPGHRGAPALLCWPQQRGTASAASGKLLLRKDTRGPLMFC
ncbi:Eukaryotic initiation factor 4F subunit p150 isoform 1 [Zea mays]|uniref:Eukaryotic initiation factor 4F subunit p150 isoform 1 n=1 Tax=Zea mays TaxID=4577 RepID=A0A1D6I547_MAIZE|nr:Eukaryotic initiation factor 4F subunit p150 isoform 1 [Zea mays]